MKYLTIFLAVSFFLAGLFLPTTFADTDELVCDKKNPLLVTTKKYHNFPGDVIEIVGCVSDSAPPNDLFLEITASDKQYVFKRVDVKEDGTFFYEFQTNDIIPNFPAVWVKVLYGHLEAQNNFVVSENAKMCDKISPETPIQIQTNKENYERGETIQVFACLGPEAQIKGVGITIYDEIRNQFAIDYPFPNEDGTIESQFEIQDDFEAYGVYTVEVDASGVYTTNKTIMISSAQNSETNDRLTNSAIIPQDYVTEYSSEYYMHGGATLWDDDRLKTRVVIQTATHLAKPGSSMVVQGDISHNIMMEIDKVTQNLDLPSDWRSNCCTVDIFNQDGVLISQHPISFIEKQGQVGDFVSSFMVEPGSFLEGQVYTVKPGLHFASNVMDAVNPEVFFHITEPHETHFIVAAPSVFSVFAENRTFNVQIASNSVINDFSFSQSEKKLSFTVDENTASRVGVTQITIPEEMLGGEILLLEDGQQIPLDSAIVVFHDNRTEYDVEIHYLHDTKHVIEILGTQAIPEFPISFLVLAGSVAMTVIFFSVKLPKF